MKVIVSGSRNFINGSYVFKHLDRLTRKLDKKKLIIVSGGSKGPDYFAEQWCFVHKVKLMIFHPDWEKHKKSAGIIRNEEMACFADAVIAFWDGESPGTADMIQRAKKKGLKVKIIKIPGGDPCPPVKRSTDIKRKEL